MSFLANHAKDQLTDPEVYHLYDAIAAKVDDIIALLAEKRRASVAILKDYTDNLLEMTEAQIKPAEYVESDTDETDDDDGSDNADTDASGSAEEPDEPTGSNLATNVKKFFESQNRNID